MKEQKRIRDYGIVVGGMETGMLNSITDVEGVKVGHVTLNEGEMKTGVTAILPHGGNLFKEKVRAAVHVINGFGKTMGTIQIEELGTIETPIVLTNTLSIGAACDGLIDYMILNNPDICSTTGSVNPVVCECNDQYLNDIRGKRIKGEHVFEAIENAGVDFEEGAVGAGTGMACLGLKGGIGTASRVMDMDGKTYTMGALVMSNFGTGEDLLIDGIKAGKIIKGIEELNGPKEDKGSIIMIIATDLPLTERQLKRVCRRAGVGLSRTGSHIGNGSGDIVISFTTANRVMHYQDRDIVDMKVLNENRMDKVFRAAAESIEEAILNSLICAKTTVGKDGHTRKSLCEYIDRIFSSR